MSVSLVELETKRKSLRSSQTIPAIPAYSLPVSLKQLNTWSKFNTVDYKDEYHPASLLRFVKGVIASELTKSIKPTLPTITDWIIDEKLNSLELYRCWIDNHIRFRIAHNLVIEYLKDYISKQTLRGYFFAPWSVFIAKSQWGWTDNSPETDRQSSMPSIVIQVNNGKQTDTNNTISKIHETDKDKAIDVSITDAKG